MCMLITQKYLFCSWTKLLNCSIVSHLWRGHWVYQTRATKLCNLFWNKASAQPVSFSVSFSLDCKMIIDHGRSFCSRVLRVCMVLCVCRYIWMEQASKGACLPSWFPRFVFRGALFAAINVFPLSSLSFLLCLLLLISSSHSLLLPFIHHQ